MIPMLFNTEMSDAIQGGRKIETRRLIKGALTHWPFEDLGENCVMVRTDKNGVEHEKDVPGLWATFEDSEGPVEFPMFKAPCKIGDAIWVRETWATTPDGHGYLYRANMTEEAKQVKKWRPSIHMPYEAARLFLRVKSVQVEHLQDITEAGAIREGLYKNWRDATGDCAPNARTAFAWLWDTTVKPADRNICAWGANPWVWVIRFKRITRKEAERLG